MEQNTFYRKIRNLRWKTSELQNIALACPKHVGILGRGTYGSSRMFTNLDFKSSWSHKCFINHVFTIGHANDQNIIQLFNSINFR